MRFSQFQRIIDENIKIKLLKIYGSIHESYRIFYDTSPLTGVRVICRQLLLFSG